MTGGASRGACSIVPPYLLDALTGHTDEAVAECARRSLDRDHSLRRHRTATAPRTSSTTDHPVQHQGGLAAPHVDDGTGPQRTIADAQGRETTPGTTVRAEGQPATGDPATDEAYDGFGHTWSLFDEAYLRDSVDGRGLPLLGTVHYGSGYDNAFWDGTQMVFGDGDDTVFNRFTIAVDVIGTSSPTGSPSTPLRWTTRASPAPSTRACPTSSGPWSSNGPCARPRRRPTG